MSTPVSSPSTLDPHLAFEPGLAERIAAEFAPLAVPERPVHLFERDGRVALLHRHHLRLRFLTRERYRELGPERAIRPLLGPLDPAPPPRPAPVRKVLQAVITSRCNLRCRYCTVFNLPQPARARDMDRETLDACLASLGRMDPGSGLLIIHGGEPLLVWDKVRFLAERSPVHTVMFTNGLAMTPERAAFLAEHDVNVLVSIDGPASIHDRQRCDVSGAGSFERSIQGFVMARDAGCETGISLAIGPHNAPTLRQEVPRLVERWQPASIGLNLPHYTEQYPRCTLDLEPLIRDLQELLAFSIDRKLFLYPHAKFVRPLVQQRFKHHDCSALGDKIVVFPDGRRSNCISHTANALGPQDLDVWNHLLPVEREPCRRCPALGICGGGCFFDAMHFQDGCAYDLRYCTLARSMLAFLIWDMDRRVGKELPTPQDLVPAYAPMGGVLEGRAEGLGIGIGHETDDG